MPYSKVIGDYSAPIAIGGVGGSGTRLIAACVQELGVHLGTDLNQSLDNLTATLLFRQAHVRSLSDETFDSRFAILAQTIIGGNRLTLSQRASLYNLSLRPRPQTSRKWLLQRAQAAGRSLPPLPSKSLWGWKTPATHFIVDQLLHVEPKLKYINVVRNGLDLAFSPHQKGPAQLARWGKLLLGERLEPTPRNHLRFWCAFQKEVAGYAEQMGVNFLEINFEKFCTSPDEEIQKLVDFVGEKEADVPWDQLREHVKPPESIGRFREFGTDQFDPKDLAFVAEKGFDVV